MAALAIAGGAVSLGTRTLGARLYAREAEAAAAFPAMGQLVPVETGVIHAEMILPVPSGAPSPSGPALGHGRDVVLIHGASGNTRDFTFALGGALAAVGYRVTAFDRPGLGWSSDMGLAGIPPAGQARAIAQAARSLGITAPIVLGQSYGASVALAWALDAGDILQPSALVLVSGASLPWEGGLGMRYDLLSSRIGLAAALPLATAFTTQSRIAREIAAIFAPEPVPPGYAAHIGAELTLRRAVMRVNLLQVARLKPHLQAMAPRYPDLRMPVEMVHGTADMIVPPQIHAAPLLQILPGAALDMIDGAGHMPHHTRPDRVIAAIARAANRSG